MVGENICRENAMGTAQADWDHTTSVDGALYDSMSHSAVLDPQANSSLDQSSGAVLGSSPLVSWQVGDRPRWRYPAWLMARTQAAEPILLGPRDVQRQQRTSVSAVRSPARHKTRWQRASLVWLSSFIAHLAVLVLLGLITVAAQQLRLHTLIAVQAEVVPLETHLIQPVDLELKAASLPRARLSSGESGGQNALPTTELVGSQGAGLLNGKLTGPVDEVRALFGPGGPAMTETATPADGAEFFGVRAGGKGFVFVVDSSRSMTGRRWADACYELLASVRRLGPEKSFYVIFFDAEAHCMYGDDSEVELVPATAANILRLEQWIATMRMGEDTKPCSAVQVALGLQPDAIFLLSDGEFADPTATFLRRHNSAGNAGYGVAVHTIGFHSRKGQGVLQRIARENHGQYQFVPAPHGVIRLSRS